MGKKGWRGADLFFDLDLDPMSLPPEQRTYEALLKRIQAETRKLLDFLLDDFALKRVTAVFSGQKGYHLHVRDPEVIPLSGPGRREIVDYITATGLELEGSVLYREGNARGPRRIHAEGGWGRRMARRVVALMEGLATLPPEEAAARVRAEFDFLTAAQARTLAARSRDPKALARIRDEGNIDFKGFPWAKLVERMTVPMLAKPDQLVTGDVHRLARTPASLHGTTALRVTPLEPDRLRDFDPLREAVALREDPVAVEVAGEIRFRAGPERFHLGPGVHEVPEYAAAHLLAGAWQLWLPPPNRQGFSVKLAGKSRPSN